MALMWSNNRTDSLSPMVNTWTSALPVLGVGPQRVVAGAASGHAIEGADDTFDDVVNEGDSRYLVSWSETAHARRASFLMTTLWNLTNSRTLQKWHVTSPTYRGAHCPSRNSTTLTVSIRTRISKKSELFLT